MLSQYYTSSEVELMKSWKRVLSLPH